MAINFIKCRRIIVEPNMVSSSFDRIVANRTGCLNLMVWNDEAKFFIGKSAKELTDSQKGKEVKSLSDEIESIFKKKFLFKLSVSTQNVNSIDLLYVVDKICDDQRLIGIYSAKISSQITGMDHRVSDLLPNTTTVEANSEDHGSAIVSLSKDFNSQSHFGDAGGSPPKAAAEDPIPNAGVSGMASPGIQDSNNRSVRRTAVKRKYD
ncbi:hypothetical protein PIB30_016801 [Stylosanthes scabra]|uniref:Uncharacterized protein n=1 Tax=Stylosanthes scabra TaxID=79078 RepID=A0ABU6S8P8_9FABA|nr:hypothetical protein [Stylosanthes scabra]